MDQSNNRYFWLLAGLCAFAVANIYYNQPLLALFAKDFGVSESQAGAVAMWIQLAYAAGLVFFVPLGDRFDRKKLLLLLFFVNSIASLFASFSQTITQLIMLNIMIGMTAISAQLIIPMVSLIALPEQRGKAVGIVVSGLMVGILFGRTLSGLIGHQFGWRAMYIVAAILNLVLLMMVLKLIPSYKMKTTPLPYLSLLKSLIEYFLKEKELRLSCLCGALMFGSFSALWGGLAFLLARSPYYFGSNLVGSFGLAGLAGIFATPYIGKLTDRYSPKTMVRTGAMIALVGFVFISFSSYALLALVIGLIFLDVGGRAGLIGNQLRALNLSDNARSRLNTVFMFSYFLGGAIGTKMGAELSTQFGWIGIAIMGMVLSTLVIFLNLQNHKT